MPRWKYTKKKDSFTNQLWVYLEENKPKKLKIYDWQFVNNPDGMLFKSSVIEEDGQVVDKFWSVWDHDLKETLKKKLKVFKPNRHKVELIVTKKGEADDEEGLDDFFELEMITKK